MSINLNVEYVPIQTLNPYANNPRKHSICQVKQIAKSIKSASFINPILIDRNRDIIAGHGRFLAAQHLGLELIPVITVDHLSDKQIRAYRIADNKIAENSTWDEELLKVELEYLSHIDLDIDMDSTGFTTSEIDILLGEQNDSIMDPDIPSPPSLPITTTGDLWLLGLHRILCGDCRDQSTVNKLMGNNSARIIITDPPYNVKIDGHARGLGKVKHNDFQMASGEMDSHSFTQFLQEALSSFSNVACDGSLHYIFIDWRHVKELLTASSAIFDSQLNLCVWAKTNGGMGSMYRSQHELVFVFKKGIAQHINNIQLGQYGRYRTNLWQHPGVNSFGTNREESLTIHPTVKPTQLIADVILDASNRHDIILDGFLGSGTTILAAEQTGRIGYGLEIEPKYVDVSLKRWMTLTGDIPILEPTGETYQQVAEKRGVSLDSPEDTNHGG
jgi:DNA modification methylase